MTKKLLHSYNKTDYYLIKFKLRKFQSDCLKTVEEGRFLTKFLCLLILVLNYIRNLLTFQICTLISQKLV